MNALWSATGAVLTLTLSVTRQHEYMYMHVHIKTYTNENVHWFMLSILKEVLS